MKTNELMNKLDLVMGTLRSEQDAALYAVIENLVERVNAIADLAAMEKMRVERMDGRIANLDAGMMSLPGTEAFHLLNQGVSNLDERVAQLRQQGNDLHALLAGLTGRVYDHHQRSEAFRGSLGEHAERLTTADDRLNTLEKSHGDLYVWANEQNRRSEASLDSLRERLDAHAISLGEHAVHLTTLAHRVDGVVDWAESDAVARNVDGPETKVGGGMGATPVADPSACPFTAAGVVPARRGGALANPGMTGALGLTRREEAARQRIADFKPTHDNLGVDTTAEQRAFENGYRWGYGDGYEDHLEFDGFDNDPDGTFDMWVNEDGRNDRPNEERPHQPGWHERVYQRLVKDGLIIARGNLIEVRVPFGHSYLSTTIDMDSDK